MGAEVQENFKVSTQANFSSISIKRTTTEYTE